MNAPQITYIVLMAIALLFDANLHGKQKTGKHNFWIGVMSIAINFGIMYWGGFFDVK